MGNGLENRNITVLHKDVNVFMDKTKFRLRDIEEELNDIQHNCENFYNNIDSIIYNEEDTELDIECNAICKKIDMIYNTVSNTLDEIMEVEGWLE